MPQTTPEKQDHYTLSFQPQFSASPLPVVPESFLLELNNRTRDVLLAYCQYGPDALLGSLQSLKSWLQKQVENKVIPLAAGMTVCTEIAVHIAQMEDEKTTLLPSAIRDSILPAITDGIRDTLHDFTPFTVDPQNA